MGTLRFILALSIAMAHSGEFKGWGSFNTQYTVQTFFMISGFLIAFILAEKYNGKNWLFYSNRALRIYVPYLFMWASTLLVSCVVIVFFRKDIDNLSVILRHASEFSWLAWIYVAFSNVLIFGQEMVFILGLHDGHLYVTDNIYTASDRVYQLQLLPQGWSMSLELMFYIIAPYLLTLRTRALIAIVVTCISLRAISYHYGIYNDFWSSKFFIFELPLFLAGGLAYRLYRHPTIKNAFQNYPWATILGTIIPLGIVLSFARPMNLGQYFAGSTSWGNFPWGLFMCMALSLPCLFHFSRKFPWDRKLGDLSYSMYLIQNPVIFVVTLFFPNIYQDNFKCLVVVMTTIVLSLLFTRFIEAPLDRFRERRVTTQSQNNFSKNVP